MAGDEIAMSFDVAPNLESWLIEAGFVNVNMEKIRVPVGGQTRCGKFNQTRLYSGVVDFSGRLLSKALKVRHTNIQLYLMANHFQWNIDYIDVFLAYLRYELKHCSSKITGHATHYQIL